MSRYDFINEGTPYSSGNNSQRYVGQLNEAIQPRVRFSKTPSYGRNTDGDETSPFERRTEVSDSHCFTRPRSGYKQPTNRRQPSPEYYGLKIPPFNGKED